MTEEIHVENTHGRRDNVVGMLPDETFTGEIKLSKGDERFMCSCCSKLVHSDRYIRMLVDSQGMVWCGSCWTLCLDWTIRSAAKNPEDPGPRYIHPGGKYYQRLNRSLYEERVKRSLLCGTR